MNNSKLEYLELDYSLLSKKEGYNRFVNGIYVDKTDIIAKSTSFNLFA